MPSEEVWEFVQVIESFSPYLLQEVVDPMLHETLRLKKNATVLDAIVSLREHILLSPDLKILLTARSSPDLWFLFAFNDEKSAIDTNIALDEVRKIATYKASLHEFCKLSSRNFESITEEGSPKRREFSARIGNEPLKMEPIVFIDKAVTEKTKQHAIANLYVESGGFYIGRVFVHRGESIVEVSDIVPDDDARGATHSISFSRKLGYKTQALVDEKNRQPTQENFSPYRIIGDFHSHPFDKKEGVSDAVLEYHEGKPTLPDDHIASLRDLGEYNPYNVFVIVRMRDNELIPYRYFQNPETINFEGSKIVYSKDPEKYYFKYKGYLTDQ